MLFTEIIAVFCENHRKYWIFLCKKICFILYAGGTYINDYNYKFHMKVSQYNEPSPCGRMGTWIFSYLYSYCFQYVSMNIGPP
jgi:hypothetical protein